MYMFSSQLCKLISLRHAFLANEINVLIACMLAAFTETSTKFMNNGIIHFDFKQWVFKITNIKSPES